MKKLIIFAFALSLFAPAAVVWSHAGHDGEHGSGGMEMTVKGELVDLACYMAHEGKGPKHVACGKMCVKEGAPLGIVSADGKTYLLIEDHSTVKTKKPYAQAKEQVGDNVTVHGDMYSRGGLPAIVVESVSKE